MPKRFLQLNEVERQYMNDLTPEQREFYDKMPWGEQMMGYLSKHADRNGNYWSAAFWNPLNLSVVRESLPVVTALGGWFGPASPWSRSDAFRSEVESGGGAPKIASYGWLKAVAEATAAERVMGKDLMGFGDRLNHFLTSYGPSLPYRLKQIEEAQGNTTDRTDSGLSVANVVENAIGLRNKPLFGAHKEIADLTTAYRIYNKKLDRDLKRELERARNNATRQKEISKKYKEREEKAREAYFRALNSNSLFRYAK